jgi:hypothetical protein
MTCRIQIKFQLTGRARLILEFYYVISLRHKGVTRDFKVQRCEICVCAMYAALNRTKPILIILPRLYTYSDM